MKEMFVRHIASGEAALAKRVPGSGCIIVQFNRLDHPHSHGWHLYPRHHFKRWRLKGSIDR